MTLVKLDSRRITDWDTFHDVFAEVFGFPGFYGRNMNAWIDCLTCLDDPSAGMTSRRKRCHAQYDAIIECASFVNWRRIEKGDPAVLALSFFKNV